MEAGEGAWREVEEFVETLEEEDNDGVGVVDERRCKSAVRS